MHFQTSIIFSEIYREPHKNIIHKPEVKLFNCFLICRCITKFFHVQQRSGNSFSLATRQDIDFALVSLSCVCVSE